MFWRFGGYANVSSIETILEKPDCTLEEVLDENDVEQELKSQNARLIEFLRDELVLGKLLKYVTAPKPERPSNNAPSTEEEPSKPSGFFIKSRSKVRSQSRGGPNDDFEAREEKWRRYSFVSTQLLSADVWSIVEALFEGEDLLRQFWEYVKHEPELDNMQAGNFAKVNEFLLDKKPVDMIAFLKTLDGVVADLVRHVNCPVMMDLLLKIISLEKEAAPGVVSWLQDEGLIPKLLSFITPDKLPSVQTAAGDFLKAIITISANATGQDTSVIGPNELTRQLVSEQCINQLLGQMLKGGNPLTVGVGIVIEVIRKNNSDYDQDTQVGPEPKSSDPIYLGTLLRIFAIHINDFMDLILSPKHTVVTENGSTQIVRKDLPTAWGARIEPLGFDRFKTCELMAELLHCSNMGLLNEEGAEAEVKQRDDDRERLKSEGKLAAQRPAADTDTEAAGAAFAASVDSQGFHHAEAFSPLGESPVDIRSPGSQQLSALEEEFEKVDLSAADTGSPTKNDTPTSPKSPKPSLGKRRSSLLTQQLQREKEKAQRQQAGSSGAETDKPAPLFASRTAGPQSPSTDATVTEARAPESASQEPGDQQHDTSAKQDDPVVGDLLKMKFVEHHVVPTIIDFFFRFPWNNFLHNVVYDVVQQVFNGAMYRGYNRHLAIDLFETGRITERVVEGQKRSDESQKTQKMRLGYMGHLTLIAEEVVKFTERQVAEELSQTVVDKVTNPDWLTFVDNTLSETRERDNAILGGVRPDNNLGPRQAVLNAVNAAQNTGFGGNGLANSGLTGGGGLDSLDLVNAGAAGYGLNSSSGNQLLSGFTNSDDEEDDYAEEGEIGGGDGAESSRRRHHIDDEDQTQQDEDDEEFRPAPLALPPIDKAKRAFLRSRRKAGRRQSSDAPPFSQAMTAADDETVETPDSSDAAALGAAGALAAAAGFTATATADAYRSSTSDDFPEVEGGTSSYAATHGGFEDDFTGFGSDEVEAGSSDEGLTREDYEAAEEEEEGLPLGRQSTTEAVTRRPLDEGSNSSEEEYDGTEDQRDATTPTQETPFPPQPELSTADAKKHEQEKLLRDWGLMAQDDSDDDDEPTVSLGSKYLARRRTGS